MRIAGVLIGISFLAAVILAQKYPCLPVDVNEDTVVGVATNAKPITVGQTLRKLKARCSRGRLVDGRGKAIYFYKLQGCWGNPPADYLEILNNQRKEIRELKKKYTVVEMTCNPGGAPVQSIS